MAQSDSGSIIKFSKINNYSAYKFGLETAREGLPKRR